MTTAVTRARAAIATTISVATIATTRKRVLGLDDVGSLFGKSVCGCHHMCSKLDREHGRIDDTNVVETVDLEMSVDDTTLVLWQHGTTASGVVFGVEVVEDPRVPVGITRNVCSGGLFTCNGRVERLGLSDASGNFEAFAEEGQVRWVGHVMRVDDGGIKGIRRVDIKATLAERPLDGGLNCNDTVTSKREQDLDLTRGCREKPGRSLVDGLESCNH